MQATAPHEATAAGNIANIENVMQEIADHKGCGTTGGSGKASCGSAAGQGDLPTEIWEKVKNHPCYSEEAHHHYARMHVAVAPACNIQCNYCNRKYDCANESRPGVVSEKLTPEQAAKKVLAVASTIPQMTVLGIAGPGDPLANPEKTFKTFELIARTAPDIKLCLSTNGLALPDHVDTIAGFNVDHVTITINMVDPEIGARISASLRRSRAASRAAVRRGTANVDDAEREPEADENDEKEVIGVRRQHDARRPLGIEDREDDTQNHEQCECSKFLSHKNSNHEISRKNTKNDFSLF